jgi:hypothetical protein
MSKLSLIATALQFVKSGENTEVRLDAVDLEAWELGCPQLGNDEIPTSLDEYELMDGGFDENLPPTVREMLYGDPCDTAAASICEMADGGCAEDPAYLSS